MAQYVINYLVNVFEFFYIAKNQKYNLWNFLGNVFITKANNQIPFNSIYKQSYYYIKKINF